MAAPDRAEAPPGTRLFLVRHGSVGAEGILYGHRDVPLSASGERQMEAVAELLAREPLAGVYCSDLARALSGARAVARRHGLEPVRHASFREMDMGRWDGRRFSEIWDAERSLVEAWWRDLEGRAVPGGESLADLRRRVLPALREVVARHAGEAVCLVAHGGVNRVILFEAMGLALGRFQAVSQDYGCVNLVEYFPDGNAVVRLVNRVPPS